MTFEEQIKQELQGLSQKKIRLFAWRCGIRALPMLGYQGHFNFWEKQDIQKYLFAVFNTFDTAATATATAAAAAATAYATSNAATAAANAATAAANATNAATAAATVTTTAAAAATYAAYAAYTAYAAYANAYAYAYAKMDIKKILLEDISNIRTKQQQSIAPNTYSKIWDNFQQALKKEECYYWANWFKNLFENNFEYDKEEVQRRLNLPDEIKKQGAAAVGRYMEQLNAENNERLNEARIIILGDKGAGKTCVARKLIDPNAPMTTPKESTAGVDTTLWQLKKEKINVRIWDFAGHTVTHAVHQFFLSERCLYIMVYDGRSEARNRLAYWLDHMKNYGGNSKAIILVNKRDPHEIQLAENRLKEKYPIHGFYYFNVGEDKVDLQDFREDIMDYIVNNPSWKNQEIPKSYYLVKKDLEARFNKKHRQKGQEFISKTDFLTIAKKHKVDNHEQLLKDLHALGISLWYQNMAEYETLILNPEWISQGVYKIINWVSNEKKYSLGLDGFQAVFNGKNGRFPQKKYEFLFNLIKHYELAYEAANEKRLIIPHLFQEDQPADLPTFEASDSLMIQFKSENPLPPNTISRFIVRHNQQIKKEGDKFRVWKYGVILDDGQGGEALVREDDRTIKVSVKGENKTNFISEIRKTLNEIFSTYKSKHPDLNYRIIDENLPVRREIWLGEQEIVNHFRNNRPYYYSSTNSEIPLDKVVQVYQIKEIHIHSSENVFLGGRGHQITKNTFNFNNCNIELQGYVNELAQILDKAGNQEEAQELFEVAEVLEEIKEGADKKDIKRKGYFNRLKRVVQDLGDKNSTLYKTVEGLKRGVSIAQDIAAQYNKAAQWLGLPQVPTPFLKKQG